VNLVAVRARASRSVKDGKSSLAVGPKGAWPEGAWTWLAAAVSLVLAVTVKGSLDLFSDGFYDLYAGRYIAGHGIPRVNVLTVASHGAPWIDQQWLAHVLFYVSWAAAGYPAMAALSAVLVTAGFAVFGLLMLRRGVPPVRMFVWTLAAFVAGAGNISVRAQSFGFLFLPLTLWLVVEDDQSPRLRARTWLVIAVLVLWANTHGSALMGAGLVVLYAGYRALRALARRDLAAVPEYLLIAAAAVASVVCTPYGLGVIRYYRETVANPAIARYVTEWAPSSLGNRDSWAFFGLVVAVAIAVGVAWRRGARPDPVLGGITVVLLGLALTGVRYQAWFAMAGSLLAAGTLARCGNRRAPELARPFRWVVTGVLAAAAVASLVVLAVRPAAAFESRVPVRAMDVAARMAARHPAMRILGTDFAGSPMLWLHPATVGRVGYDIRYEQYTASQLTAYVDFARVEGPRWLQVTNGYDIIVSAGDSRLASALTRLPGWRIVYQEADSIVAVRGAPAHSRTGG
jgi:hypothetical protein